MADIGQSIRERPLIVAGGSYSHLPEDRPLDDPDRGKTYQHLSFPPALKSSKPGIYPAGQGRSRPSILGNGMVSRTWESPQIQATVRSRSEERREGKEERGQSERLTTKEGN